MKQEEMVCINCGKPINEDDEKVWYDSSSNPLDIDGVVGWSHTVHPVMPLGPVMRKSQEQYRRREK